MKTECDDRYSDDLEINQHCKGVCSWGTVTISILKPFLENPKGKLNRIPTAADLSEGELWRQSYHLPSGTVGYIDEGRDSVSEAGRQIHGGCPEMMQERLLLPWGRRQEGLSLHICGK